MPRRVITFTLVFLMVCLLEPLILDLKIITAVALGSEVIDYLLLQRPIKYLKEELLVDRTADATANKVEEIVTRIMASNTSNGRV